MQQRFRKLALFIGATSLAFGGLIMVACSTDNGTTATPQPDAARVDGGGPKETGPGVDTGTPDVEAQDCGRAPTVRVNTASGGFRCAFYKADAAVDGAAALENCTSVQTCCNPGIADGGPFNGKFPPAFCASDKGGDTICAADDTANGSDYQPGFFSNSWECNDKAGCPAAKPTCVMVTAVGSTGAVNVGKDTKLPQGCDIYKAFKQGGSRCKAGAAAADEVLLCNADSECGGGTTCKPFNGAGRDLGSCRP